MNLYCLILVFVVACAVGVDYPMFGIENNSDSTVLVDSYDAGDVAVSSFCKDSENQTYGMPKVVVKMLKPNNSEVRVFLSEKKVISIKNHYEKVAETPIKERSLFSDVLVFFWGVVSGLIISLEAHVNAEVIIPLVCGSLVFQLTFMFID